MPVFVFALQYNNSLGFLLVYVYYISQSYTIRDINLHDQRLVRMYLTYERMLVSSRGNIW